MKKGFQGSQNDQTRCLRVRKTDDAVIVKIGKHIFKLCEKDYKDHSKSCNLKVLKNRDHDFFNNLKFHLQCNQHHFEEANRTIFQKFILDCESYLEATKHACTFEEFSGMENQRAQLITTIIGIIQSEGIIMNSRIDTENSLITGIC